MGGTSGIQCQASPERAVSKNYSLDLDGISYKLASDDDQDDKEDDGYDDDFMGIERAPVCGLSTARIAAPDEILGVVVYFTKKLTRE